MSKPITKKQKSLKANLVSRTAKLMKNSVGTYFVDAMPTVTNTAKEAKALGGDLLSRIKSARTTVSGISKTLRSQSLISGLLNWYIGEESEFESSDFDFDDANMTFDIPTDDSSSDEPKEGPSASEIATDKISNTVVSSMHQQLEGHIELTSNIVSSIEKQSDLISTGDNNIINVLNSILEVVTKNTAALVETTLMNAAEQEKDLEGEMIRSNRFDLKDYLKIIQKNIQNSPAGMLTAFLPMLNPDTLKMMLTPEGIMDWLVEDGLDKLFPKLREGLTDLDQTISTTIIDHLLALGSNTSGGFGDLASVFGIHARREEGSTERSQFNVEKTPFDTITKEAIINVIPGYLQKILQTLSGEDLTYDYLNRGFTTIEELQERLLAQSAVTGNMYRAPKEIREAFGSDKFGHVVYDSMMTDLGSRANSRDILESFQEPGAFRKYVEEEIFKKQNVELSDDEKTRLDRMGEKLQGVNDLTLSRDMNVLVAKQNLERNRNVGSFLEQAEKYNLNLGDIETSVSDDISKILRDAGFNAVSQYATVETNTPDELLTDSSEKEIRDEIKAAEQETSFSGTNYTNKALYLIFKTLNRGINVFKVGELHKLRRTPFEEWGDDMLPPPVSEKVKSIRKERYETGETSEERQQDVLIGQFADTPNTLFNQTDAEGNEENLTKIERFNRWSKDRIPRLLKAVLSGDREGIKNSFGLITRDVGQVGGKLVQDKLYDINSGYGNIIGSLKHKLTGAEYSYRFKDEEGNEKEAFVHKNDNGGVLGFLKDELSEFGKKKKNVAARWLSDVKGYFVPDDDPNTPEDVKARRKKLIYASIGALGGGILGGPLGILMGTIAGSALSNLDVGSKIKDFLFGRDKDDNATGLLTKFSDTFIEPIKYQVGKTANLLGTVLKKNILGPIADMGIAVKDRIVQTASDMANSTFGKAFKLIGNIITAPFRLAGKLFKLPASIAGALTRGTAKAGSGLIGGTLNLTSSMIAGKSKHTYIDKETGEKKTVSTKQYLRMRRKERNEKLKDEGKYEVDEETGEILTDENGNKIKNRYSSYKAFRESEKLRRKARKAKWDKYTGDTTVDIRDVEKSTDQIAENTEKAADAAERLRELGEEEGSIFTHDEGLHSRLDDIANTIKSFFGGKTYTEPVEGESTTESIIDKSSSGTRSILDKLDTSEEKLQKNIDKIPPEARAIIEYSKINNKTLEELTEDDIHTVMAENGFDTSDVSKISPELQAFASKLESSTIDTESGPTISKVITESKAIPEEDKEKLKKNTSEPDETSTHSYEVDEDKRYEDDQQFANSAVTAAASITTTGGISDTDQKLAGDIVTEAANNDSNKSTIVGKLKELMRSQSVMVLDENEEKKSIFSTIAEKVGGVFDFIKNSGLGDILGSIATIGGVITLLNTDLKDVVETVGNVLTTIKGWKDKIVSFIDEHHIDELFVKLVDKVKFAIKSIFFPDKKNHDDGTVNPGETPVDQGVNAITGAVGDAVTEHAVDFVLPGTSIYHTTPDGSGELVHNKTAEIAKNNLTVIQQAKSSIFQRSILGAKAAQIADNVESLNSLAATATTKAEKYRAMGNETLAKKYDDIAEQNKAKAAKGESQLADTYSKKDSYDTTGSDIVHGVVRNVARVGVGAGISYGVGKGAGVIADYFGASEETKAKVEKTATAGTAAALTVNQAASFVTGKKSLIDKILDGLLNMLKFIAEKLKVAKPLKKFAGKIDGIINKIYNGTVGKITDAISKKIEQAYTLATGKQSMGAATLGVGIAVGALAGIASGVCDTEHLFGVLPGEADNLMKTISGIMAGIFGALEMVPGIGWAVCMIDVLDTILINFLGCGIKQYIARELYKLLAGEEGAAELANKQMAFSEERDWYNETYGAQLDDQTFNDKVNNGGGFIEKLWRGNTQYRDYQVVTTDEEGNEIVTTERHIAYDEAGGDIAGGLKGMIVGGEKAYVKDENGNVIKGEDGKAVLARDAYGNVLKAKRDENGNIIEGEYEQKWGDKALAKLNDAKRFFTGGDVYKTDETGRALVDENGNYIIDEEKRNKGFKENFMNWSNDVQKWGEEFSANFADMITEKGKEAYTGFLEKLDSLKNWSAETTEKIQEWSYNTSLKLEEGFINFQKGASKVFTSVPTAIGNLWKYFKSGDFKGFANSDIGDKDSVSGKISNAMYIGAKMLTSPAILVSSGAHAIGRGINNLAGKVSQGVSVLHNANTELDNIAKQGDLEALGAYQPTSDDDNPIGGFSNAIIQGLRFIHYPSTGIHHVGKVIKEKMSGLANKAASSGKTLLAGRAKLDELVKAGDVDGINSLSLTDTEGNPAGGFVSGIFGLQKITQTPLAMVFSIGNKIKEAIGKLITAAKTSKTNLDKSMSGLTTTIPTGDIDALSQIEFQDTVDSPLNGFAKFIFGGAKLASYPLTIIRWIGNKVADIFNSTKNNIVSNKSALDSASSSISKYAEDGNIAGLWGVKGSFSSGDPLIPFWNLSLLISKMFNTVKAVFSIIGNKISDAIAGMENIPGLGNIIKWVTGNKESEQSYGGGGGGSFSSGSSFVDETTSHITTPVPDYASARYGVRPAPLGGELEDTSILNEIETNKNENIIPKNVGEEVEGGNPLDTDSEITSTFGPRTYPRVGMHKGVDIAPSGDNEEANVESRYNGTISYVRKDVSDSDTATNEDGKWKYDGNKSGGNMVWIDTPDGKRIKNMHLKSGSIPNDIEVGSKVEIGDKIGQVGSTGFSTGPHLHYQVEKSTDDGLVPINPSQTFKSNLIKNLNKQPIRRYIKSNVGDPEDDIGNAVVDATQNTDTVTPNITKIFDAIKNIGTKIINFITGGLFGNDSESGLTSDEYKLAQDSGAIHTVGTAEAFLDIVRAEIGVTEHTVRKKGKNGKYFNEGNHVKYNVWYYGYDKGGSDAPWCVAFVQWCYHQAGLDLPHKTASTSDLHKWYKNNKPALVFSSKINPKPGDIVIYNGHIGIVEHDNGDGKSFTAIEGNTSFDEKGSQDNGGAVARKSKRLKSKVVAFIRPVDFESMDRELSGTIINNGAPTISSNSSTLTSITNTTDSTKYGNFPKYSLNDKQIKGIANILEHEQSGKVARQAEASLMGNLIDYDTKGDDSKATTSRLVAKIRGTSPYTRLWFANGRQRFDNPGNPKQETINIVKDVLVSGHRVLPRYVNEHDMLGTSSDSDIGKVENNGVQFNKFDRAKYIPNVTKVYQNPRKFSKPSTWTFSIFPSSKSDPFGYTSESYRQKWGDAHWPAGEELESDAIDNEIIDNVGEELNVPDMSDNDATIKEFSNLENDVKVGDIISTSEDETVSRTELDQQDLDKTLSYTGKRNLRKIKDLSRKYRVDIPNDIITPEKLENENAPTIIENLDHTVEWQPFTGEELESDAIDIPDNIGEEVESNSINIPLTDHTKDAPHRGNSLTSIVKQFISKGTGEEIDITEPTITKHETSTTFNTFDTSSNVSKNYQNNDNEYTTVIPKEKLVTENVTTTNTNTKTETNKTETKTNIVDLTQVISLLRTMAESLSRITSNTQSSTNELHELNSKEFVDKGLRNTFKALGSSKAKASYRGQSVGNTSLVSRMSRL